MEFKKKIALEIVFVFLAMGVLAPIVGSSIYSAKAAPEYMQPAEVSFSVRGTYLRADSASYGGLGGSVDLPGIVDLQTHGIQENATIMIYFEGLVSSSVWSSSNPIEYRQITNMYGLFSSTRTLLGISELHRVPGAVDAGVDVTSGNTYFGNLVTDIPEDFKITQSGFEIQVPKNASFLFLCFDDTYYPDNVGPPINATIDVDSDGDGLWNKWETEGIDVNGDKKVDLDLPALGVSPWHKDLFVEIDYMRGGTGCIGHRPDPLALGDVKSAFRDSPVPNPDGTNGVNLHFVEGLVDDEVPHQTPTSWSDFDSIKRVYFGTAADRTDSNKANILEAKKRVFHYCLFAHQQPGTTSSGLGEFPGNDFYVTLGGWSTNPGTRDEQAATFMHELGHNLWLGHGGGDDINFKPNYLSIMNYAFTQSWRAGWRPLDYSRRELPYLWEGSLNEGLGIQGSGYWMHTIWNNSKQNYKRGLTFEALDWNGDGNITAPVQVNVNNFPGWDYPSPPNEFLYGYDDWSNLVFNFRLTVGYLYGSQPQLADPEITWETIQTIRQAILATHDVAVFNATLSSSSGGSGGASSVNVTLANFGGSDENVNVAVYANNTLIASSSINLKAENLTTAIVLPTGQTLALGNYVLKVTVSQVAGETDTTDNTFVRIVTLGEVIPEFQPYILLTALMTLSLLGTVLLRKRKHT